MPEAKLPAPQPSSSKSGGAEAGYTFTAKGSETAHEKDVDIDFSSVHHTIGKGPTQVAAGDHRHVASDVSGLTIDHGNLTGLGDDDHSVYPVAAGGSRASGTWPIGISGKAANSDALGGDAATRFGRVWTYDPGPAALRTGDFLLY